MHRIEIEDATFQRLESFSGPLADTTDTVINQVLDALENHRNTPIAIGEKRLASDNLPNMNLSKALYAAIDGKPTSENTWRGIFAEILQLAQEHYPDIYESLPKTTQETNRTGPDIVKAAEKLGITLVLHVRLYNGEEKVVLVPPDIGIS